MIKNKDHLPLYYKNIKAYVETHAKKIDISVAEINKDGHFMVIEDPTGDNYILDDRGHLMTGDYDVMIVPGAQFNSIINKNMIEFKESKMVPMDGSVEVTDITIKQNNYVLTWFNSTDNIQYWWSIKGKILANPNCYNMFNDCKKLQKIDSIDTSGVTNMNWMFANCYPLTSIPLLDTSKVISMAAMFYNCNRLKFENIPLLNTSNVTDMSAMFWNCSGLTSIPLMDTSKVTDMGQMFNGCTSLTSIPLLDTSSVIDMHKLFYYCKSLTIIPSLDTSNVTDMYAMFFGCTSLNNIPLLNTSKATTVIEMFRDCMSLISLDLSNWDISNVTNMNYMFTGCEKLETLNLANWNLSNVTSMNAMFQACFALNTLDLSNWDVSNVTNMRLLFNRCSILTNLITTPIWNTSKVNDMNGMFYGTKISSTMQLDLSNVTNTTKMFMGCTKLTNCKLKGLKSSLDLKYATLLNAESINYILANVQQVDPGTTIDITDCTGYNGISIEDLEVINAIGRGWTIIPEPKIVPRYVEFEFTKLDGVNNLKVSLDIFYEAPDTADNIDVYCVETGQKITDSSITKIFAEDVDISSIVTGEKIHIHAQYTNATEIGYSFTGLEIDGIKIVDLIKLEKIYDKILQPDGTYNMQNTSIKFFHIYGSNKIYNMYKIFYKCKILNDIIIENTSNVTNMGYMFYQCISLISLDLSHFDTSNVTNMHAMFSLENISENKLTYLNVSSFNTSNVTDMGYMFRYCMNLISLDVSHFDTSKVTNMSCMFDYCKSLISLDVSHFDTSKVWNMNNMFGSCKSLTLLDVSHFDTSNVTNTSWMFGGCILLTSLDLSHFNTSKVNNMFGMFNDLQLTSIDVSSINTSKVKDIGQMFCNCSKLTSIDVSHFDTSNVTNIQSMFSGCEALTSLDLSNFNLSNVVESMIGMFSRCTSLENLKLKGLKSSLNLHWSKLLNAESIKYILANMSYVNSGTTLDITGCIGYNDLTSENTEVIYAMSRRWTIIPEIKKVTTILPGREFNKIINKSMTQFIKSDTLPVGISVIDISAKKDKSIVTWYNSTNTTQYYYSDYDIIYLNPDCYLMFYYCKSLTTLGLSDLSNFDTSNVTRMEAMFGDCVRLTTIPLLNTSNVINMCQMFSDCWSLTTIPLLDTSNVTNMSEMFTYCYGLITIPLLDTSNVTDMSYMFYYSNINNIPLLDTSNVTDMENIFYESRFLTTIPLLNVYKVPNMTEAFEGCYRLEECKLQGLYTSVRFSHSKDLNIESIKYILNNVQQVNSGAILDFTSCIEFSDMSLTDPEIQNAISKGWTIIPEPIMIPITTITYGERFNKVINKSMRQFVKSDILPTNIDTIDISAKRDNSIITWYDNGTNTQYWYCETDIYLNPISNMMFSNCTSLTTIPLLDTSNVTDMEYMFGDCSSLTTIPLLNTSKVKNMYNMFNNCPSLTTIPLLDTSNVTDMGNMFGRCYRLTTIPLLDTSKVTDMSGMFSECKSLTTIPLLDTSKVTDMIQMFFYSNINNIPLLDTSKVTDMSGMFNNCPSLTTIPLLDTSNVTDMGNMFYECRALTTLDLSTFNTSNVISMEGMFSGCVLLVNIIYGNNFTKNSTLIYSNMFLNCPANKPSWFV